MIVKIYKASFAQSIHLTSSDNDTYFYQSKIPEQPIPSLISTARNLKKYMKSLKSHQKFNAHEIDRFTDLLEEFIQNEGFGSLNLKSLLRAISIVNKIKDPDQDYTLMHYFEITIQCKKIHL